MSDEKTPAPDPEIPDELRNKLSRDKRPGGFAPKSPEAEEDNPAVEAGLANKVKDLRPFFKKLAASLKGAKHFRTVTEKHDVKRDGEWIREERTIKVPVAMFKGEDGLPYTSEPVSADETRRMREKQYADAPPMDRLLGDLTPAFAEWLYLNHAYDAAVRYAGRTTHIQAWAVAHVA